jgi:uncharacterized paraquat-inducible protein A
MSENTPTPSCPNCGYELTGINTDDQLLVCPECGKSVKPSYRKTQSLRHAYKLAIGLIGVPSVGVPLLAILVFQLVGLETTWKITRTYHQLAFVIPFIWVPIVFWITIRYKKSPAQSRDISGTIGILFGVTCISALFYIALFMFTILSTSGL